MLSGCICCGGGLPGMGSSDGDDGEYCTPPYIQVGSECCLDRNDNSICDSQETPATTMAPTNPTVAATATTLTSTPTTPGSAPSTISPTTTLTPTTLAPTTTLAAASCADGVRNQGEEYIDCGGPCSDECEVFKLKGAWREFKTTGYKFRLDEKTGTGDQLKYYVEIETPDGIEDRRPLSTGESFVDYLRFKVIDYDDAPDQPTIYMKINKEDLYSIPEQASLLTIGGLSCTQLGSEMCERTYNGYTIRMLNRIDNGARVQIVGPTWEVPHKTEVREGKLTYAPDHGLVIGGFFDRSHFINGGYSLFYVYLN
ncbi:MAG: hypothetical protein GF416_03930 [Candidatus Altiarchaeales archaeon]|nr:hypothetical protein [Candidatus Altiarchaeales archaeon]MBD3416268.1 hypothetical protein [Candidatus Altiarchaeales archaeon]